MKVDAEVRILELARDVSSKVSGRALKLRFSLYSFIKVVKGLRKAIVHL